MDEDSLRHCIKDKEDSRKVDLKYIDLYKKVREIPTENIIADYIATGNSYINVGGQDIIKVETELSIRALIEISRINKKLKT